jgi:hypothetical protein
VDNWAGTFTGAWDTSTYSPGYYGSDYHYHLPGAGTDTFTWPLTINTPGTYEVFARWTDGVTRPTDATYTVYHDWGSTPVLVDMQMHQGQWVPLGAFDFDGAGVEEIQLGQHPDGYVIADAIKLVPVEPGTLIVDNWAGTFTGAWGTSTFAPGYYGSNYHYHLPGAGTDTFTWTPVVTIPGTYEVFARWTDGVTRPTDATYTVYHDAGSTPVPVNMQVNEGLWVSLGTFGFDGADVEKIELVQHPDGYVIADAIKWELQP